MTRQVCQQWCRDRSGKIQLRATNAQKIIVGKLMLIARGDHAKIPNMKLTITPKVSHSFRATLSHAAPIMAMAGIANKGAPSSARSAR